MKYWVITLLTLVVCTFMTTGTAFAFFGLPQVTGYAWSSNIGWISFSGPGYGVAIDTLTGEMVGYAWSSNIGWIQFDSLSSFPGGGGAATVDLTTNKITGWARACAATASGDCTGPLDPDGGGWDGWISLSCENNGSCATANYGLSASGGAIDGFAWGSDVIGWVDFIDTSFTRPCSPTFQCLSDFSGYEQVDQWCEVVASSTCSTGYSCDPVAENACITDIIPGTISVAPPAARSQGVVEVSWAASNALSCTLNQQNPGGIVVNSWSGLAGTASSEPITSQTVFSLVCTDITGLSTYEVASTTIRVLPNLIET